MKADHDIRNGATVKNRTRRVRENLFFRSDEPKASVSIPVTLTPAKCLPKTGSPLPTVTIRYRHPLQSRMNLSL
jgi:hypothetical protein